MTGHTRRPTIIMNLFDQFRCKYYLCNFNFYNIYFYLSYWITYTRFSSNCKKSLTFPAMTLPLNPTRRLPRSSLYDQLSIPCPISEYSAAVSADCTLLFRSPRLAVAAVWRQSTCLGLLCISDQLQRWPNSARCNFKFNIYANPL